MKNLLRSGLITASLMAAAGAQASAPDRIDNTRKRAQDRVEVAELQEATLRRVNTVRRRAYRAEVEARWQHQDNKPRS